MRTRIANGTVVTAERSFAADVVIEGESIVAVTERTDGDVGSAPGATANGSSAGPLPPADERVIDASGRLILPGGIDAHTHLDMPLEQPPRHPAAEVRSADDFYTGTVAAAVGGTTTIVDYATQARGGTLAAALDAWQGRAAGRAVVDYGFHMIVCDYRPEVAAELDVMVAAGVTSFKLFMAYPGRLMLDDGAIFRTLLATRDNGGLVCMHAENGHVIAVLVERALAAGHTGARWHALTRPPRAEAEATHRAIALAEIAGVPIYIVHLSAAEALEEVERARARGTAVFAETCPHYLFLSDGCYEEPGPAAARYVLSPPLRARATQAELWRGLAQGSLDTVATDHCPFCLADKARGAHDFSQIPNGGPGIEHRMSLLWDGGVRTGRITAERFVEVTATAPARIFGLAPRKGAVAVGADADLLLWDPTRVTTIAAATHHMRVDYDLYEGRRVVGGAEMVWSRGRLIVDGGRFVGRAGDGCFLPRAARQ